MNGRALPGWGEMRAEMTATTRDDTEMRRYEFHWPAKPEPRLNGEPDWMPDPAQVAQARNRLERDGLDLHPSWGEARRLVAPGETPWIWWAAAALWVIVWPALIVLRLRTDLIDWAPAWLLPALALVHMLALAAPVLYAERASSRSELRRRFGVVRTLPEMLALGPGEFEAWTALLFRLLGYRVTDTQLVGDHGIDLLVSSDQLRRGVVQCKRYRGTVGEPTVRDLYGTMMHENADFAWLVTTGAISRQAREWAEGKPMELWDGRQLMEMARRYR